MYSIIRIIPITVRIWDIIGDVRDIPLWLIVLHHICCSGVGVANAIVWYFGRKVDVDAQESMSSSNMLSRPLKPKNNDNNGNGNGNKNRNGDHYHYNNRNDSSFFDDGFSTQFEMQTV